MCTMRGSSIHYTYKQLDCLLARCGFFEYIFLFNHSYVTLFYYLIRIINRISKLCKINRPTILIYWISVTQLLDLFDLMAEKSVQTNNNCFLSILHQSWAMESKEFLQKAKCKTFLIIYLYVYLNKYIKYKLNIVAEEKLRLKTQHVQCTACKIAEGQFMSRDLYSVRYLI